ncbi:MAG: adenylate/guanylate cyclase domain-containing protein [Methyloprofundus sp.]|nr:adenylate/guanylate cyclase domain-containing protein [Methyloprofundus sp.]
MPYQLLVKVNGRDNLRVPLILSTETQFNNRNALESLWIGIFYGALWIIILNNLLFFIILRDKEYLNLAVFLALITLSLMNLDGINVQLFWQDAVWWNKVSLVIFQLLAMLVGLVFTCEFLRLKVYSPWWHRFFRRLVYCFYLFLIAIPFVAYEWLILGMSLLALLVPPMVLAAALLCFKRKYRPARFFLLAWSAVLVGTVSVGLVVHNIIPINLYTLYGMHFGVLWLGVMLSVAMADRFSIVQKEKNAAQEAVIHQQKITMESQKRIMNSISRFVPNQFLMLLEKLDITEVNYGDAVLKNMVIMFTDIRGFTALSEGMSSEENFKFLNSYMSYMEPVIESNHGFVDKFIGDAIMALFPETADQAINAAIKMHKELDRFNLDYSEDFGGPIYMGVGIHSGDVVLGTVGTDVRLDTTVIGDTVNVTSRLESLTKKYQVSILISDSVYNALQDKQQFAIRVVGLVEIRGKKQPLLIYEVFDGDTDELKLKKQQTAPFLEQAVGLLMVDKKVEAKRFLKQCLQHYPEDTVTTELLAQYFNNQGEE